MLVIIGSSNGSSPIRCHTNTWNDPDSKFHGAYMGPTWGRQDPAGPHVGPMNLAIRATLSCCHFIIFLLSKCRKFHSWKCIGNMSSANGRHFPRYQYVQTASPYMDRISDCAPHINELINFRMYFLLCRYHFSILVANQIYFPVDRQLHLPSNV